MGKMVADTRAAIDSLTQVEMIDAERIYLMGYSLGAKVGLLTAALDARVGGLAAISGFDPLRLDTADRGVEGIRHFSHLHGLLPRLGFFVGSESRLPFDFDAALALAAPRPVLLIAPTLDRYARPADVAAEVNEAGKVWGSLGKREAFTFETPVGFNTFRREIQERVFNWLASISL
jgi:dienelactone hydrolase